MGAINIIPIVIMNIVTFPPPGRLFGKAWREEFVVLYEDSTVIWEEIH